MTSLLWQCSDFLSSHIVLITILLIRTMSGLADVARMETGRFSDVRFLDRLM